MLEEDYIMRLIKEMIRAIIKVLFNVDTESPTEELLDSEEDRQTLKLQTDMVDDGQINEAENKIYDMSESGDKKCLEIAIWFYLYLNKKTDNFLEQNDFRCDEIKAGLQDITVFALKAVSRNYSCKRLNIHIDITSTIGKIQAANIPAFRLLFAVCVIYPIMYGPIEPPISPAIASSANIDVPPRGIFTEVMLIVPGHIMPTEKPQSMQPIRPRAGLAPSEVSK